MALGMLATLVPNEVAHSSEWRPIYGVAPDRAMLAYVAPRFRHTPLCPAVHGSGGSQASECCRAGGARVGAPGSALLCMAGGLLLGTRRHRRPRCRVWRRQGRRSIHAPEVDVTALFDLDGGADHGDTMEGEAVAGVEEEICELIGYDLGEALVRQIGRPFAESERLEAYRMSGFERAVTAERPQAVWLIGPSASGKSTLAPMAVNWVGIGDGNYVMVDGEAFRDSHRGYQEALVEGKQRGCVWWGAYVGIRENVDAAKRVMLQASVEASKNLVIPSTCLRNSQCVDIVDMLLEHGYLVHVVGLYGERGEIVSRGRERARRSGKRYDPREFGLALQQFAPMMQKCNGRYFTVCTTNKDCWSPQVSGCAPVSKEEAQSIMAQVYLESGLPIQQAAM